METNETTMEQSMETSAQCQGSECSSQETQLTDEGVSHEYEEATFAVLLAMVPLLVFTLFGQVGLF